MRAPLRRVSARPQFPWLSCSASPTLARRSLLAASPGCLLLSAARRAQLQLGFVPNPLCREVSAPRVPLAGLALRSDSTFLRACLHVCAVLLLLPVHVAVSTPSSP
jgi:hypothetical protein